MNKSDLIDAVSRSTSLAKREAEAAVNALVHTVVSEVKSGRRVVVAGFGSFNPTHRGARMGRNPQTGAPVKIKASRGVRFAPSTTMKDIVNGKAAMPKLKSASPAAKSARAKPAKSAKAASRAKSVGKARSGPARKAAGRHIPAKATRKSTKKVVRRAPAR